jgi:hypothetical protein
MGILRPLRRPKDLPIPWGFFTVSRLTDATEFIRAGKPARNFPLLQ